MAGIYLLSTPALIWAYLLNFGSQRIKKSIPMYDNVNRVERDAAETTGFCPICLKRSKWKVYYDMTDNLDKAGSACFLYAFLHCEVDKIGSMMSRGIPYVVDKDGNEKRTFADIRNILNAPQSAANILFICKRQN